MKTSARHTDHVFLFVMAIFVSLVLGGCGAQSEQASPDQTQQQPSAVSVQTVARQHVAVYEEYPARANGAREVEVRARVDGLLLERLRTEGETVTKRRALWQIDPRPFEVSLLRAEAELANSQANMRQAEREWERVAGLFEQNAVSERERDQARSSLELAQASVAVADAQSRAGRNRSRLYGG